MKKVLIIGSGMRVRAGIVPALWGLKSSYTIASVYARHARELSFFDGALSLTVTTTLDTIHFADIDIIVVAIPADKVAGLLQQLSAYDISHCVLLLDTPVISLPSIASLRFCRNFKRCVVSEESVALPPFLLARQCVEEGLIGDVSSIYLFHSGYRYHALSTLRMLTNSSLLSVRSRAYRQGTTQKEITFSNGMRACMYEPYEPVGKFLIEGERGYIADYEHEGKSKPTHRIEYRAQDGIYQGMLFNGAPVSERRLDREYARIARSNLFDPSLVTSDKILKFPLVYSMKVRALMDSICAADEDYSPLHYRLATALEDATSLKIAEKFGFYCNPFSIL